MYVLLTAILAAHALLYTKCLAVHVCYLRCDIDHDMIFPRFLFPSSCLCARLMSVASASYLQECWERWCIYMGLDDFTGELGGHPCIGLQDV